jgi:hypothetical protein
MEFAKKLWFEHQDKSSLVVFASRKAMRELAVMQLHSLQFGEPLRSGCPAKRHGTDWR